MKESTKISRLYQSRHPWVDTVSPKITLLGDWGIDCGIAGLFLLGGVVIKDKKARDTGLMALETLLHTGLLVAGRQAPGRAPASLGRERQDYWFGPGAFFKRYSERFFFALRFIFFRAHRFGLGTGHGDRRKL